MAHQLKTVIMSCKPPSGIIALTRQILRLGILAPTVSGGGFLSRGLGNGVTSWDTQSVKRKNMLSLGQPTNESHSEFYRNPSEVACY